MEIPQTSAHKKTRSANNILYINGVPSLTEDLVVHAPRPSSLPPKSAEELERQAKEIELIQTKLKKQLELDEKERERREAIKAARDKRMQESKIFWLEVINTWPQKKSSQKTRQQWWQGFPPSVRGKMWELVISNDLNITPELFDIFAQHAEHTKEAASLKKKLQRIEKEKLMQKHRKQLSISTSSSAISSSTLAPPPLRATNSAPNLPNIEVTPTESTPTDDSTIPPPSNSTNGHDENQHNEDQQHNDPNQTDSLEHHEETPVIHPSSVVVLGREDTVELIPLDLPRTFPALSIFQDDGPYHNQLKQVLEAYVCYRPDVGYVQGMSYLAAILLLNVDTFPAFKILANLLNRPCHLSFFRMNEREIELYMEMFDALLAQFLPKIHKHFKQHNMVHTYLVDWIMTLYSKSLPIDLATRIWDVYFLEGDSFLFRTALGILQFYAPKMQKGTFDEIMNTISKLPNLEEEELFSCIEKIELTPEKYSKVVQDIFNKK